MRKKIITYFLLSVLLIQLLPVKEMGQLLSNNQLTEEICDGLDSGNEHSEHKITKKIAEDEFLSKFHYEQKAVYHLNSLYLLQEVKILSRIFDDTLTPPPLV